VRGRPDLDEAITPRPANQSPGETARRSPKRRRALTQLNDERDRPARPGVVSETVALQQRDAGGLNHERDRQLGANLAAASGRQERRHVPARGDPCSGDVATRGSHTLSARCCGRGTRSRAGERGRSRAPVTRSAVGSSAAGRSSSAPNLENHLQQPENASGKRSAADVLARVRRARANRASRTRVATPDVRLVTPGTQCSWATARSRRRGQRRRAPHRRRCPQR